MLKRWAVTALWRIEDRVRWLREWLDPPPPEPRWPGATMQVDAHEFEMAVARAMEEMSRRCDETLDNPPKL